MGSMLEHNENPRAALSAHRRIVVKIGSRAIIGDDRPGEPRFQVMADQIAAQRQQGRQVVLVSSGAMAMGAERLGLPGRPEELPLAQAAAAVGQSRVIQAYEVAFGRHGIPVAQVLLTHDGMADRKRYLNAQAAIEALLELGAVPIINENDTVSTEEIEFGDNDQLAAMVASQLGADLLILLTDVEGLLDHNGLRISRVEDLDEVLKFVWAHTSRVSLGGMASKISAARRAVTAGVPVVIGPARDPNVLERVVEGEDVGTLFLPVDAKLASRKHWIAHTLKPLGTLRVDSGAARAVIEHKRSLLAAGIRAVEGDFRAGDAVRICLVGEEGELARGLSRYDAKEIAKLLGAPSSEIEARVGHYDGDAVVHRDDMVVL